MQMIFHNHSRINNQKGRKTKKNHPKLLFIATISYVGILRVVDLVKYRARNQPSNDSRECAQRYCLFDVHQYHVR